MNPRLPLAALVAAPFIAHAAELPDMAPGAAASQKQGDTVTLSNAVIAASWAVTDGHLAPVSINNLADKAEFTQSGKQLFRITTDAGEITSASMKVVEPLKLVAIPAKPNAPRACDRFAGKAVTATLRDETTGLSVAWRAILRDGSNYIRQEFVITGTKPANLTRLAFQEVTVPGSSQAGSVTGSPVTAGNLFFGTELPVAKHAIAADGFSSGFSCKFPVDTKSRYEFSTVAGVAPAGQMRRAFQYYLERERARAATPFLHYNGWFDMGTAVTQDNVAKAITGYGEELIKKRGVKLDSFVLDDGWDDCHNTFWEFDTKKLPKGLQPLRDLAGKYKSGLGIWISPLGGYGEAPLRIANAKKLGAVAPGANHLDLSFEPYYKWYKTKALTLMQKERMNYFKWDKAGDGESPHFMSLLRIARELHAADPSLYMNVTVGTWPSPFWLNHIDCTWNAGADCEWIGKGDDRERWITWRDNTNLNRVQKIAPLYPLNSIMLHGIVLGRHYQAAKISKAGNQMKNEVRSFFATGTMMQELYLSADMMSQDGWDRVAESAKWARANASTLADARIFGDQPALNDQTVNPYGYASWSSKKSIIMVRNPDNVARDMSFDIAEALELPESHKGKTFAFGASYPDQRLKSLTAKPGEKVTVKLDPFEVLVFETK